jgi:catechol 2,3-dioxygenase-like lactoylglutathione lyase family enzyme
MSRNIRSIFHLNINCSSLEQAVAFYERLGFTKALDLEGFRGEADPSYQALGISGTVEHKGPVVLFLGDDLRQTRLDLMEWVTPTPPPHSALEPQSVGVPRIALWTKNLREFYGKLVADGVEFLTTPTGPYPDRAIEAIVALRDPDGLLIELIEFMPSGKALYQ